MRTPIILASASPRRRRILARFNVPFTVTIPHVEEVHWNHRPTECVQANARRKLEWCCDQAEGKGAAILAADTLVVFDGRLIGKPANCDEARRWLTAFSGRQQTVLTACAMSWPDGSSKTFLDTATVTFKSLTTREIDDYLECVDPLDKAGGYDVDEYGDRIIANYSGEWTTVMGLPLSRVTAWLSAWGAIREC